MSTPAEEIASPECDMEMQCRHDEWDVHLPSFLDVSLAEKAREGDKASTRNTFSAPPGADFKVRDHGYLQAKSRQGKKTPSEEPAYSIAGINVFTSKQSLEHAATKVDSLKNLLENHRKSDGQPEFLIFTWLFKAAFKNEFTAVVHLFRRTRENSCEENSFERAFARFLKCPDAVKKQKLKFVFVVREAPVTVRTSIRAMGGERPVLIGKALKTSYFHGENYLEVDMDVGSSKIASILNSTIMKTSGKLIVDTSWLIEAQEEDELPERLLGAVRWNYVSISDVRMDLD